MAGYIGSKTSVTQVDGYNRTEADAEFVNDPNSVISVSGSNVGIGISNPSDYYTNFNDLVLGSTSTHSGMTIASGTSHDGTIAFADGTSGDAEYKGFIQYNHTNNAFGIGTNGLERMHLDSSGRVMIGTTTEGQNQADNLTIADAGNMGMTLRSTDSGETSIFFSDGTSGAAEYAGWLQYVHSSDYMTFGTSGTESMRLTSGGYLAVGNTLLPTSGTAGVSLAPEGNVHCGVATTANTNVMRFDNPNGRVGSISTTNSSTSYNTSSDYRLKTDAQPMTGASERVQELNPVNFEWVVDGTRTDGFLAHEAQEVVPEAVTGEKDAMRDEEYEVTPAVLDDDGNVVTEAVMGTRSVPDYQGIDQSKLVPLLTAALQEALTEIADLKARVTALEAV
jgi:hypothetical protein